MNIKLNGTCWAVILYAVAVGTGLCPCRAQGTAFTYNGRLTGNGALATGPYEMQFTLYDTSAAGNVVGSPLTISPVDVVNGLFTVRLDFGPGVFTGPARWLNVAVRPVGGAAFTPLAPRLEVMSSPYSIRSQSAGSADSGGGGNDSVWSVTANNAYYAAGNVGIGTSTPQTRLHILGDAIRFERDRKVLDLTAGTLTDITARNTSLVLQSLGGSGSNHLILNPFPNSGLFPNGNVGIGTFTPQTKLHVFGDAIRFEKEGKILDLTAGTLTDITARNTSLVLQSLGTGGDNHLILNPFPNSGLFPNGNVGIGTFAPQAKLHVNGNLRYDGTLSKLDVADNFTAVVRAGDFFLGHSSRRGEPGRAMVDSGTTLHLNFDHDWATTQIGGATTHIVGNASVQTLTIRGGADVAEPFAMPEEIAKGAVVVIDEAHPGQLKLSTEAYDTRVAGVVSGANGINPGIALHQEGRVEGGQNVALSGRVYVQADASHGAIKPGDLLTTSETPGHAMKVGDFSRAQGAILGKAMTGLRGERGLVLVLVTLQ